MSHSNYALKGFLRQAQDRQPDPDFSNEIRARNGDLAIPFEHKRAFRTKYDIVKVVTRLSVSVSKGEQ
jgi:hypothetical protein